MPAEASIRREIAVFMFRMMPEDCWAFENSAVSVLGRKIQFPVSRQKQLQVVHAAEAAVADHGFTALVFVCRDEFYVVEIIYLELLRILDMRIIKNDIY